MIPLEILRRVRRLQLRTRKLVQNLLGGEYLSAFKGSGLSFEEVRPYCAGDDVRSIDWNVTARCGTPFVKRFLEERELTLFLALDVSASMNFGSQSFRKREVAAELGAILATCAEMNKDRLGFLAFSDQLEVFIPPSRGIRHTQRIIRDLLLLQGKSKGTNLNHLFDSINQGIKRRAIVFVLSDFQGLPSQNSVRLTSKKHDFIAVRITDPFERKLPTAGILDVKDCESDEPLLIDTQSKSTHTQFMRIVQQADQEFLKMVRSNRIDWIDVTTQGDHLDRLLAFFQRRKSRRG